MSDMDLEQSQESKLRRRKERAARGRGRKVEELSTENMTEEEIAAAKAKRRAELQAKEAKRNQRMMEMRQRQAGAGASPSEKTKAPKNNSVKEKPVKKKAVEASSDEAADVREKPVKERPVKERPATEKAVNGRPERVKTPREKAAAPGLNTEQKPSRKPRTEEEKQRIAELRRRKAIQERKAAAQKAGMIEGLSPEEVERRRVRRAKIAAKRAAAEKAAAEREAAEQAAAQAAENTAEETIHEENTGAETRVIDAEAVKAERAKQAAIVSMAAFAGTELVAETRSAESIGDEDNSVSAEVGEVKAAEDFVSKKEDADAAELIVSEKEESDAENPEEPDEKKSEESGDESEEDEEKSEEDEEESEEDEEESEDDEEDEEESEDDEEDEEESEEDEEESEDDEEDEEESEEDEEESEKKGKKELTPEQIKKRKKLRAKLLRITGYVAGVIVLIYAVGAFYYMNHFYPNTTLNGLNVSNRGVSGVKHILKSGIKKYEFTIVEKDGTETVVSAEDFGLYVDWDKDAVKALIVTQPGYDWPLRIFSSQEFETENPLVVYDQGTALSAIEKLPCMDSAKLVQPVNATVVKDDATKKFIIKDEIPGTVVDTEKLLDAIIVVANAMGDTLDMERMDTYADPAVTVESEELHDKLASMNECLDASITYNLGDTKREVLDSDIFFDWIYIDDEMVVHVDEDPVIAYVDAFAEKYDDYKEGRWFITYYGQKVYIPNSVGGWKTDKTQEVAQIIRDIKSGEQVYREANYSITETSHDDQWWGSTYIEVNITRQHMWMYKDGACVISSDVVTGCVKNGTITHTGIFKMFQHFRNAVLRGANYVTPVDYWMAFNGGEGLHDAYWRSSFGGSIYQYSGSHGCVNLPSSVAKVVYENSYNGYPVIVYKEDMTQGPTE